MTTPTLVNLPPSDPVTPSDMGPGTPNSGTTSLSALSTTAIKDGHQGQPLPHGRHTHHSPSTSTVSATTLEAERADRISRLAGLERLATSRNSSLPAPTSVGYIPGYFDSHIGLREKSTVGSASVTGSVGGRTTWASGSDAFDPDKMSEDPYDADSTDNVSDEGDASLVAFGEGASTISGPSSQPGRSRMSSLGRTSSLSSPSAASRPSRLAAHLEDNNPHGYQSISLPLGSNTPGLVNDARMVDGMTYDPDVVDTTTRTPEVATPTDKEVTG